MLFTNTVNTINIGCQGGNDISHEAHTEKGKGRGISVAKGKGRQGGGRGEGKGRGGTILVMSQTHSFSNAYTP